MLNTIPANTPNDHLTIVLVQPQGPVNIGAVCRVMMNFGFTRLRLVDPTSQYKSLQAKKMALSAFWIVEQAAVHDSLESALSDIQLAFGTTRRFGKYRKHFFTPAGAAKMISTQIKQTKCALVMGPEDTGLETKDLDLCHHFITIPTHEGYPSMNLSHALSVLLYETALRSDLGNKLTDPEMKNPASVKETEHLFAHMKKTLLDIDYLDPQNPDHLLRTFRRVFGRAGLSSREVRILEGLMSRIDWTENQRKQYMDQLKEIK